MTTSSDPIREIAKALRRHVDAATLEEGRQRAARRAGRPELPTADRNIDARADAEVRATDLDGAANSSV